MKMNVRDERHVRAFAYVFESVRSGIVRHRDTHDLASRGDHLIDLLQRAIDVGRVRLGHRLDDHRRTAADLNITNLYRSSNSRH